MQRGAVVSTAPRRGAPRPELVRVGGFGGGLVLAGLAAAVAGSVAGEVTAPGTTTAVRLVLLVAGALVAGLGLAHPLAGAPAPARPGLAHPLAGAHPPARPGPWHRRVAWTAGLLAAVAALAGSLHGDVGRTGTLAWVVAALAVPVLLETRLAGRGWPLPLVALPGTALVAVTFGSAHTEAALAADVVYAVASTVLLGALVALALRGFDDGAAAGHRPAPDVSAVGARSNGSDGAVGDPSARPSSGPASAPGRPVRLATVGVVAAVTAALAGAARILTAGPHSVTDLVGTAYGRTALVAVALPALAAVVLVTLSRTAVRRGAPSRRGAPHAEDAAEGDGVRRVDVPTPAARGEAGRADGRRGVLAGATGAVAVVGIAAASVAGLLPAPAPAAVPGQALMRTVALDGENVPVLIAPMRPGPNLVQLGGSGYPATGDAATPPGSAPTGATGSGATPGTAGHDMGGTAGSGGHEMATHGGSATVAVDGDPVGFVSRPGARGGWAVVDVPAGTTSLTVEMAGDSATVPIEVGDEAGDAPSSALTGRDGPECVSAIVGAVVAGGPQAGGAASCPSQTLDPRQAEALTATVRTMAGKGARTVRLVGDASPRSVTAARLVRDEGAKAGLAFTPDAVNDPNSALVVVSGWEQAVGVLGEVRQRAATTPTHLGGTFLAPWLLTGDVLRQTASAFLPLPFAPNEPDAQRFALALAATHPDTAPSASGYLAWARTSGVPTDPRPSLYGAAAVNVPMSVEPQGSSGHHGGPDPAAWFPGGTVVPVSGPMEGSR